MSTSASLSIRNSFIPDLINSDYEFNRHNKLDLEENISVCSFEISTSPFVKWESFIGKLWTKSCKGAALENFRLWGFIFSPFANDNSSLVRRYGFSRPLYKNMGVTPPKFDFEKSLLLDGKIIFYGGVGLSPFNSGSFFDIVSDYENGFVLESI